MQPTLRPATQANVSSMAALDREVFGIYGADESPNVIAAGVRFCPAGCAVLEEAGVDRVARFLGYLTTEKWASAREPTLDEDPYESHVADGRVVWFTTLVVWIPSFGVRI